ESEKEGGERIAGQYVAGAAVRGSEILVEIKRTRAWAGNVGVDAHLPEIGAHLEGMLADKLRVAAIKAPRLVIDLCWIGCTKRVSSAKCGLVVAADTDGWKLLERNLIQECR